MTVSENGFEMADYADFVAPSVKPYYRHAGVTIYHGNCLEVLPRVGPFGMVLTDPPYGVGIGYESYTDELEATTAMVIDFIKIAEPLARVTAFTSGKWETRVALYQRHPPRWRMCWYKGAQSTASPIGFCDWEEVMVYGDKICTSAHDYFYAQPERMGAFGHPCPKPLAFAKILISRLAKSGELICDPFMGSGTTLRAALDMGHPAIGIEMEERYCEIAAKRLQQEVLPLCDA